MKAKPRSFLFLHAYIFPATLAQTNRWSVACACCFEANLFAKFTMCEGATPCLGDGWWACDLWYQTHWCGSIVIVDDCTWLRWSRGHISCFIVIQVWCPFVDASLCSQAGFGHRLMGNDAGEWMFLNCFCCFILWFCTLKFARVAGFRQSLRVAIAMRCEALRVYVSS